MYVLNLGTDEIAKYPFLAEAGSYLQDKGFTLEQFGTDPDLKIIVDKAFDRIIASTDGKIYLPKLDIDQKDSILPLEVFSFLIAIVLLKLCGMNTLINRFSLAESRRAEKFLERDLSDNSIKTNEELAIKIFHDIFKIDVKKQDQFFVIPIQDYVKHAINFHEREWKLINRRVEHGHVFLSSHETVRLIRKELGNYINLKIKSANIPPISEQFNDKIQQLNQIAKKFSTITITSTEYPPCIKHALKILEKGENLPHSGRFMLATFLLGRGKSVVEIAPLFKNAPDYNEKITLYQLNQISGESGSGTKYAPPSCDKIKSNNLCFAIPECDNIINPSQFGKTKK